MSEYDTSPQTLHSFLSRRDALRLAILGGIGLAATACGVQAPSAAPAAPPTTTGAATVAPTQPAAAAAPPSLDARDATPEMGALIKKAQAETGGLNLYTSVQLNVSAGLTGAFTARYGIGINTARQVTAVNTAKLTAEAQGGKMTADIGLLTDVQFLETATKNGWIVDPKSLNLPAVANFPTTGVINGNAFTQTIASYDIAYNTNQVKGADIPTKWEDVLNPKWKGQLYIPDPRGNTSSLAFFYLMLKTYGESFLTGLQAQALRVVASGTTALNNIAAGDGAMLVANNKFSNAPLVAAGAPIGNTVDIEPTTYLEEYMFILNGGPSPNSAAVFLNFAISEAGQFAQCNNLCSSVLKIPSVVPTPNYTPMTPLFNEATANAAKVTSLMGL